MTTAGWYFMTISCTAITLFFGSCLFRVLRGAHKCQSKKAQESETQKSES